MDETFETVEKFLVYMSQICKDQVAIIIEVFSDGPSVALRFIERLFEQCVRRREKVVVMKEGHVLMGFLHTLDPRTTGSYITRSSI
jgi:hypothetical protein